jgi:hypothetical protein
MRQLQKGKHYKEKTIKSWNYLIKELEKKHPSTKLKPTWIFKGHENSEYLLQTTLERAIGNIEGIKPKATTKLGELLNKKDGKFIRDIERGLIRRFQRQCYHFDSSVPEKNKVMEWLALLRHYGAPTRLHDWTYSFYVAIFFAVEQAQAGDDCAVWALNKEPIMSKVKNSIPCLKNDPDIEEEKTWKQAFQSENPSLFVYPTNPFRLNERLVIQQGDLLCPGDISKTFEENLAATLHDESDFRLFKYIISFNVKERKKTLLQLHRMNINRATLFPGLAGFAQSLKTLLVLPEKLLKPPENV